MTHIPNPPSHIPQQRILLLEKEIFQRNLPLPPIAVRAQNHPRQGRDCSKQLAAGIAWAGEVLWDGQDGMN